MKVSLPAVCIVVGSATLSICLLGCREGSQCADFQEDVSVNVDSTQESASATVGSPPVPDFTAGQEFIYEGSLVTLQTSSRMTEAHRFNVRTRVTVVSENPEKGWNLAYATSTRSNHPQTFGGQTSLQAFDYLWVTSFGEFRSGAPPLYYLGRFVVPPFVTTKTGLKEGHWQSLREISLASNRIAIKVAYAAGAQEQCEGHTCFRLHVQHGGSLPATYSALGFSEAEDPRQFKVSKFTGDLWIDETTGWLVRASYHIDATFVEGVVDDQGRVLDARGRPTDPSKLTRRVESDYILILKETALVPESGLPVRERQVKALYELDRSFGHFYRNAALDAVRILKQVDAFENDFPASPYAEIVASYRARAEHAFAGKTAVPFDPPIGGPLAGKVAANFDWETADGRQVELSHFRGKPVVLLFFASRIAAGQRAFLELEKWYNENRNKGVQVVAVKLLHHNRLTEVEDVVSKDVTLPALDDTVDISPKYNIVGDVNVFLLDNDQRIQYFRSALYPAELTEELDNLLKKK